MPVRDEKGRWLDGAGEYVHPKYIDKIDKARDRMVERHLKKATALHKKMVEFKAAVAADIEKYFALERSVYGGRDSSNAKGNKVFSDFAGRGRIDMRRSETTDFDDRIWIVQERLMEFIDEKLDAAGEDLRTLVNHAFKPTKGGRLDKTRILGLLALEGKIKHPKMAEAMKILRDCIKVVGSNVYFRFEERGEVGTWDTIVLDIARL